MNLNKEDILNIDQSKFDKLTVEEQKIVLEILQEFADSGFSQTLEDMWNADYEEIPVDIITFISDDKYLGKSTRHGTSIYPFWKEIYKQVFSDDDEYLEIVLTGAIGIGKTRTAVVCLCYLLYLIMCLKNPHEFFKFNEGDEITIAFCNITVELAEGVAFNTMHEYLLNSPWFLERGTVTGKKVLRYNPPKHITMSFGSKAGHFLGKQIYAALMDECDFTRAALKGTDVLTAQNGVMDTYTQIKERINSRFIVNGKQYGRMFLVSSKKSEHDFLESYVRKLQTTGQDKNLLVVDKPQWVVKPEGTYSKETFKVAVGNRLLQSFIIPTDDANNEDFIKDIIGQGYNIIDVPESLKQSFILNINTALMNLAGISVVGTTSYFNYALFSKCYLEEYVKPFSMELLEIGLHDDLQIKDFFHIDLITDTVKSAPHFFHIDTSLKGDITGLSDIAIVGKTKIHNDNGINDLTTNRVERCYKHIFTVGIKAPQGDEISLEKTRQFLYYLRENGFNIKRISIDGFQSADTRQILDTNGFDAIILSMDKLKDGEQPGYSAARSAMNDGRVGMIPYERLENELVRLQRDNTTGKVDHPIDGCFTKDTKIVLVDGRTLSIEELLIEQEYKTNWVYTINETTLRIEPKPIKKVFQTKIVNKLLEIELDNGEIISCTPEHRFMLRNGEYKEAFNLDIGQSLMPLYTKIGKNNYFNYRMFYEPFEQKWHFEHRSFCKNNIHKRGYVIHHRNYNKLDNCPTNLIYITVGLHRKIHNNNTLNYNNISNKIKLWHRNNKNTDAYKTRNEKIRIAAIKQFSNGDENHITNNERWTNHIKEIETTFNVDWNNLTLSEKNAYGNKLSRLKNPEIIKNISLTLKEKHKGHNWDNAHKKMSDFKWVTNGIDTIYIDTTKDKLPDGYWYGRTFKYKRNKKQEYKNHKIVSIREIHKCCRVYDLEIEDNHNFALAAGVFVHNSKDLSDSFAGALYNASTYEESPTFNLDLLDSMEVTNYDEDEMVKEQAKLAQQLLMNNKKKKTLPEPIGLLDNVNKNNSNNTSRPPVSADDFVIF